MGGGGFGGGWRIKCNRGGFQRVGDIRYGVLEL